MINEGFVLKPRCIKHSSVYRKTPCTREIWDYLIREANYTENKSNGRLFKRGEMLRTFEQIKHDLRWNEGCCEKTYTKEQIRSAIEWLRSKGMISTDKTTRGLIIQVCNYDYYQTGNNYTDTASQTVRRTHRSPHKKNVETQATKGIEEEVTPSQTTPQPVRSPQTPHTINKNDNNEIIHTYTEYGEEVRRAFKKFQEWILTNAPSVANMKEQFTIHQFTILRSRLNDDNVIIDIIEQMENWEGLTKRISAFKTFNTFYRNKQQRLKSFTN